MYCAGCGYSLFEIRARACPECGRPFDPESFAAEAARHGIELLGPPGTLPE